MIVPLVICDHVTFPWKNKKISGLQMDWFVEAEVADPNSADDEKTKREKFETSWFPLLERHIVETLSQASSNSTQAYVFYEMFNNPAKPYRLPNRDQGTYRPVTFSSTGRAVSQSVFKRACGICLQFFLISEFIYGMQKNSHLDSFRCAKSTVLVACECAQGCE